MNAKPHTNSHSLLDDIKQLFPCGTRGTFIEGVNNSENVFWNEYPRWPPDLFAAAAFVLDKFDGYTILSRNDFKLESEVDSNNTLVDNAVEIGEKWRNVIDERTMKDWQENYKPKLQNLWSKLIEISDRIYTDHVDLETNLDCLKKVAVELLIIADEAAQGIGFSEPETWVHYIFSFMAYEGRSPNSSAKSTISKLLQNQKDNKWITNTIKTVAYLIDNSKEELLSSGMRITSCILVSSNEVCVHPKTQVPIVGCTIRSLSKNLALLPPETKVRVNWNTHIRESSNDNSFNILAIPFPFNIDAASFNESESNQEDPNDDFGLFSVEQTWLYEVDRKNDDGIPKSGKDPHPDTTKSLVTLVKKLVDEAKKHVNKVDVVIFPELALDYHSYDAINKFLTFDNEKQPEDVFSLFISGVHHEGANQKKYNSAYTSLITDIKNEEDKESNRTKIQLKHHRWLMDERQIVQYSLGDSLEPSSKLWWEDTPIENRCINFMTFRKGACFTTLICEDLARIDPCHHVVRAIGPNIVFALLMDGAQIKGRWPERYAMGLSDDPGSSIFTFTSLGLVKRSNFKHNSSKNSVGLWRDQNQGTQELIIPEGCQGLLLTTNLYKNNTNTLDGRCYTDEKRNQTWTLTGATPLKVDHEEIKVGW